MMIIKQLGLENWKNFKRATVPLSHRTYLIGPNAAGKSNLLDAFRFVRDVSTRGLTWAVDEERGGISAIRSLFARRQPNVTLSFRVSGWDDTPRWEYTLSVGQNNRSQARVTKECVRDLRTSRVVLDRPDREDERDDLRLSQTHLEQINANKEFRELASFFKSTEYLHVVPQAVRDPRGFTGRPVDRDPFGRDLLARVGKVQYRTRAARLTRIAKVLQRAVPQLEALEYSDDGGEPHLVSRYRHWRSTTARQHEAQLSDGTLRFFGLLWALLEDGGPLLFEEPELSLHPEIVRRMPALMSAVLREAREMRRKPGAGERQLVVSTHSPELLSDRGIGADEVLLLVASPEGTDVRKPDEDDRRMLRSGLTVADVLLPKTNPEQLELGFGL